MFDDANVKRKGKAFIKSTLNNFTGYASAQTGVSEDKLSEIVYRLQGALWYEIYQEHLNGFAKEDIAPFSYKKFNLEITEEEKEKNKDRQNLLDIWNRYLLEEMHADNLRADYKKKLYAQFLEHASRNKRKTIDLAPVSYTSSKDTNEETETSSSENSFKEDKTSANGGANRYSFPPLAYEPASMGWTSMTSLFTGAATGVIFPVAASALLAGASKITICTALGFAGFPLAGMAAGIATGLIMGGVKNHKTIGAEMDAVQGFAKVGAWANGMKNSVSMKQLMFNAAAGALGGFGAGMALDLIGENECVAGVFRGTTDALGISDWAGIEELRLANESLNAQNDSLNGVVEDMRSSLNGQVEIINAQQDQIDGLNSRLDAIEAQSVAPTALNVSLTTDITSSSMADTISCPSYISDCPPNGILNVSDTINGVTNVAETDIGVASDLSTEPPATILNVSVPADALTEPAKVVVKAGDNLTHIVEKFYNVAEGSANFDKIMAEVANANGLTGNQQNWLKVNWELSMPALSNPEDLTGSLDRTSLDANWRAGDVTFSSQPKMAA
jgi:hypothetical protein